MAFETIASERRSDRWSLGDIRATFIPTKVGTQEIHDGELWWADRSDIHACHLSTGKARTVLQLPGKSVVYLGRASCHLILATHPDYDSGDWTIVGWSQSKNAQVWSTKVRGHKIDQEITAEWIPVISNEHLLLLQVQPKVRLARMALSPRVAKNRSEKWPSTIVASLRDLPRVDHGLKELKDPAAGNPNRGTGRDDARCARRIALAPC